MGIIAPSNEGKPLDAGRMDSIAEKTTFTRVFLLEKGIIEA
jgi:hypothetical protein